MQADRTGGCWDREKEDPEKDRDLMPECYGDWGQGEAMAEEYSFAEDGTRVSNVQPRPVHLAIEEARFAAIAAGDSALIDDEKSPVDSLMSNSLPSSDSSEGNDKQDAEDKDKASPRSPGTPTNASNSLSLSEGRDRDFLIDDEIADQPGLVFDEEQELASSLGVLQVDCQVTESSATLVEGPRQPAQPPAAAKCSRAGSVDTLSPCESIASDDLMMDMDTSDQSALNNSRVSSQNAAHDSDLGSTQQVFREWSNLLARTEDRGCVSGRSSRLLRSAPDSPRSARTSTTPSSSSGSPLRPPRSSVTGGLHGDLDDANYMWLDRQTYQHMSQDIVSMKTMLLKLKRLFQENEENGAPTAETLNPFDSALKNGLFFSLAGGESAGEADVGRATEVTVQEEVMDLRRQNLFLQQQLDDRERTIKLLQLQMTKYTATDAAVYSCQDKLSANAATQTERIRPVSAGPSVLQSLPTDAANGSLVSTSDSWRHRKSTPINARRLSSPAPRRRHNATSATPHS